MQQLMLSPITYNLALPMQDPGSALLGFCGIVDIARNPYYYKYTEKFGIFN